MADSCNWLRLNTNSYQLAEALEDGEVMRRAAQNRHRALESSRMNAFVVVP